MPGLLSDVDPDGLLEYSVVYTDRALNHMSVAFQGVMNDISRTLKHVYSAESAIVVPGSGTFGMEAVARQFATGKRCLVLRNGWFSFRWSQIFEMGGIPQHTEVLKARAIEVTDQPYFEPAPINEVVAAIHAQKPEVVFAAHVETASGIMLPDDYLRQVAQAIHEVGGLFVLDCIASGTVWVDMKDLGVDVLVSAPQKGWTASACCALVMLSARARQAIGSTTSTSFALDLRKWLQIMDAYEQGSFAYHATMPTDSLKILRGSMSEASEYGFSKLCEAQKELGRQVRQLLGEHGYKSVAAPGYEAPGVIVSYTDNDDVHSARKFAAAGIQAAAGVPLQCDEPAGFKTFRIGLFGLDKLYDIPRTVKSLSDALETFAQGA